MECTIGLCVCIIDLSHGKRPKILGFGDVKLLLGTTVDCRRLSIFVFHCCDRGNIYSSYDYRSIVWENDVARNRVSGHWRFPPARMILYVDMVFSKAMWRARVENLRGFSPNFFNCLKLSLRYLSSPSFSCHI